MNNEEDIVESLYKDNFQDPEVPVSKDLWHRISETIERKRRRRILGIILFSGVLLSTGLLIFWPGSPVADHSASIPETSTMTAPEPDASLDEARKIDTAKFAISSQADHKAPTAEQKVTATATEQKVTATATEQKVTARATEQKVTATATEQKVTATATEQKVVAAEQKDSIAFHKDSVASPLLYEIRLAGDNAPPAPVIGSKIYLSGQAGGVFPEMSMNNPALGSNVNGSKIQNTGLTAFVNAGIAFKNNWNISLGISVSHFQGSFSSSGTAQTTGNDSVPFYSKDILHTYLGKRDSSFTNTRNYTATTGFYAEIISIPVSIGYSITLNDRWGINPFTGIGLNYLLTARASYTNENTNEQVTDTKSSFKTLSLSALGGLMVEYRVSEKWRIYLAPSYSFFIGNLFRDSDVLKIAPSGLNASVGFRYFIK